MSWFEHGIARIYYEEHGEGHPVLLLPGFAGSIEELSPLRDTLVMANYRVIAADLPGSGRSEPQPRQYTASYYRDDAGAFAALLQNVTDAPAHILGFSDGGEVALLIASLTPNIVRSVLTWGSAGKISDPDRQLLEALYNVIDNPIPPLRPFNEYLIATYGETNARATTQSAANAMRAIVDAGGDISVSKANTITCPVLLITGEHDFFAPPSLVSDLATHIKLSEMFMVVGAGHDVHHSHSAWLAQTTLDWLKQH
ncbi:MAG TPA: alpha/beta hydrolase [Phototrophicaceae bacterium]|jgi:valacyclovir hydrolase|nr:alpha/beta hydrolase [Phototrophicaceae bacterium]